MYIGRTYGRDTYLPQGHTIVVGPSRSGKSELGHAVEAEFEGCVVSVDLKGGAITHRRRFRERHGPVYVFSPRDVGSDRYNFLGTVRFGEAGRWGEIPAVQRISDHLTSDGAQSASLGAIHFRGWNQRILEAAILYEGNYAAPRAGRPPSLGHAYQWMGSAPLPDLIQQMTATDHPVIQRDAIALLGDRGREGLWSSALQYLRIFDDPTLTENTHETTIPLDTLQHEPRPCTVFIRASPDDVRGPLRLLIRLMLDQHLALAGMREHPSAVMHAELMHLDDQAELGYLAAADHIESFYGEHKIWLFGMFQSFTQLKAYGGGYASLLDNSRTWIVFPPQHHDSSELVSRKLGDQTVYEEHVTRSQRRVSLTVLPRTRRLQDPFEIEQWPDYHAVVFYRGQPPIFTAHVRYTQRRMRPVA